VIIDEPRRVWIYQKLRKITPTRWGIGLFSSILHLLDRAVLTLSEGRTTLSGGQGGVTVTTLTPLGAKMGERCEAPLHAIPMDEEIMIIASNWVGSHHPGWCHNIKANPTISITHRSHAETYVAREVDGETLAICWRGATDVCPEDKVR
jgi:deazaflavin-dependent oxidoreductase (nitroreductase family)